MCGGVALLNHCHWHLFLPSPELPSAESLHSHPGPSEQNPGGLLEDGKAVQVCRDRHADRAGGEGTGKKGEGVGSSSHRLHPPQERSALYWPREVGTPRAFGNLTVELTKQKPSPTYTHRELTLTNTEVWLLWVWSWWCVEGGVSIK